MVLIKYQYLSRSFVCVVFDMCDRNLLIYYVDVDCFMWEILDIC